MHQLLSPFYSRILYRSRFSIKICEYKNRRDPPKYEHFWILAGNLLKSFFSASRKMGSWSLFYGRCCNTKQIILKQIPDAALVLQKYDSYPKFYEVTNWREWCWNKTFFIIWWSIWLARNFSTHWPIAFSLLFVWLKCLMHLNLKSSHVSNAGFWF